MQLRSDIPHVERHEVDLVSSGKPPPEREPFELSTPRKSIDDPEPWRHAAHKGPGALDRSLG